MFDMKYIEAADELNISMGSLYQMVTKGKLQSIKVDGTKERLLDREEVLRHKYRKQPERADVALREYYASKNSSQSELHTVTKSSVTSPVPVHITLNMPDNTLYESMLSSGSSLKVRQTSDGTLVFQPALIDEDEDDGQEEQNMPSLLLLGLILLGLILLFTLHRQSKNALRAEKTLQRIGISKKALEREELDESQKEQVIEKMKHYPHEVQELKNILTEERVVPAFLLEACC